MRKAASSGTSSYYVWTPDVQLTYFADIMCNILQMKLYYILTLVTSVAKKITRKKKKKR